MDGISVNTSPQSESENRSRTIYWLFITIALALLGFAFLTYTAYAFNLITFPFDYDQGEGFELVDTLMLSQFEWPYQNTESYPFYSSNYPPVFHIMAAPFAWFFGGTYWYGRLLGYLGTLVTAGLVYWAIWREEKRREIAILAALAFLSSNFVYHIGPLLRQHMTMVMFETLAVIILIRAFPNRNRRGIIAGIACLILAGYTKQLAAVTAVTVLMWMFIRNPRRAILWATAFTTAGLAAFAILLVGTNGEWWRQVIVANVNVYFPGQALNLFRLYIQLHGFLLIPAALLILYELYFSRLSLYSMWFVTTLLVLGTGSGSWGGGDSYFTTSITAMCILSGIFLARTLNGGWRLPEDNPYSRWLRYFSFNTRYWMPAALIIIPVLYIGFARATLKMPTEGFLFGPLSDVLGLEDNTGRDYFDSASYDIPGYANIGHFTTTEDIEAGYEIVEWITNSERPVMSEEAGFSIVANRDVITNPTQLLNLWRTGQFDGDELISMIETQEFGLIILRAQFYPQAVLDAIWEHYEVNEQISMNGFDYLLLTPDT